MTVDTHSLAQQLREAELSPTQAEAIAAAIGRSVAEGSATKSDLEQMKAARSSDIQLVRSDLAIPRQDLRTEIERSRNQLVIWFVSTQIALGALIVAVLKL